MLLCKPHHQIVDKIAPNDWPAEALLELKTSREGSGPAEALRGQVFDADGFEVLLRDVVKDMAVRTATVSLAAALPTSAGWMTMPFEAANRVLDLNEHIDAEPSAGWRRS